MRGIVLLLAGLITALGAQAQGPVAAPRLAPGDRWVYDRYGFTDRLSSRVEVVIAKIDAGTGLLEEKVTTLEALAPDARPKGEERTEQRVAATLTQPTTKTLRGHFSVLEFPLEVGKTWRNEMLFTGTRGYDILLESAAKVVGWEDVQVPAGKFRALKVERVTTLRGDRGPFAGNRSTVVWYVPEVRRWVRYDFTYTSNRADDQNRFRLELVSFQVK